LPTRIRLDQFVLGRGDPHLESDLREMLGNARPRRYGEQPRDMGAYQWLAPNTQVTLTRTPCPVPRALP